MNKQKSRRSRKKEGYYKNQFGRTERNKAARKNRISRRKKAVPQDKSNIIAIKRLKSSLRRKRKAHIMALNELARKAA